MECEIHSTWTFEGSWEIKVIGCNGRAYGEISWDLRKWSGLSFRESSRVSKNTNNENCILQESSGYLLLLLNSENSKSSRSFPAEFSRSASARYRKVRSREREGGGKRLGIEIVLLRVRIPAIRCSAVLFFSPPFLFLHAISRMHSTVVRVQCIDGKL